MHGLINKSIQCFVRDTYGAEIWSDVAAAAGLGFDNFEALLTYDDDLTDRVLIAASVRLAKSVEGLMEDLGTYVITAPGFDRLRRLFRFGGTTFIDFLHSLDDLEDRVRLAVPELLLPRLALQDDNAAGLTLSCQFDQPGWGHVVVGVLRAMADDYGALVVLEHCGSTSGGELIVIEILDTGFAQGRSFALGASAA
jgi:hypothetical protein